MAGTNAPAGMFNGSGFEMNNLNNLVYGREDLAIEYGIWNPVVPNCNSFSNAALKTADAKLVDTKMDDGEAIEGKILTRLGFGLSFGCLSGNNYLLSDTSLSCRLHYWIGS